MKTENENKTNISTEERTLSVKKKLEVLIEPLLDPHIKENKFFVPTSKNIKCSLKISFNGEEMPTQLKLSNIKLWNASGYCRTFPPITIPNHHLKSSLTTEPFAFFLPYSGQYWLDAEVETDSGFDVETKQLTLEGETGRGWPNGQHHYHWRTPIIATDSSALEQVSINRKILRLTWIILLLTAIPAIYLIWQVIKQIFSKGNQ